MKDGESTAVELTGEQRRLVRDNLGLVGVHLRRYVGDLSHPRRDREWDDLFQEGCMGLVQAAVRFREERGIPFAAFAFPRIHNAVSRALQTKFSTVHVPPVRHSSDKGKATEGSAARSAPSRPLVQSMSEELERGLTDTRRDSGLRTGETIGDRLRVKYERAVRAAVVDVGKGPSRRDDRAELAGVIARERFLIPSEELRMPLRRIARETQSSYARVAQCDKKIAGVVRARLEGDPEFRDLSRRAKHDPAGTAVRIDEAMDRELSAASSREFVRRLNKADPRERTKCLDLMRDCMGGAMEAFVRHEFTALNSLDRERLFSRLETGAASGS